MLCDLCATLPQCAGFLPNDPDYAALLKQARVDVPALFIMGDTDALIPPHRTKVCTEYSRCRAAA